jgi:hypothetical protein
MLAGSPAARQPGSPVAAADDLHVRQNLESSQHDARRVVDGHPVRAIRCAPSGARHPVRAIRGELTTRLAAGLGCWNACPPGRPGGGAQLGFVEGGAGYEGSSGMFPRNRHGWREN